MFDAVCDRCSTTTRVPESVVAAAPRGGCIPCAGELDYRPAPVPLDPRDELGGES